jgi:hypothetical protein
MFLARAVPSSCLRNQTKHLPKGDTWDGAAGKHVHGVKMDPADVFTLQGPVTNGFLTKKGMPAKGIDHRYDTCSQRYVLTLHSPCHGSDHLMG